MKPTIHHANNITCGAVAHAKQEYWGACQTIDYDTGKRCGWRGRLSSCDTYAESESWEMPEVYYVHVCPKCGKDEVEFMGEENTLRQETRGVRIAVLSLGMILSDIVKLAYYKIKDHLQ
jgi:hypothetical protein